MGITSRLTSSFCRPGQETSDITNKTAVGEIEAVCSDMNERHFIFHTGGRKGLVITLATTRYLECHSQWTSCSFPFFYFSSTLWFGNHNTGRLYSHFIMLYCVLPRNMYSQPFHCLAETSNAAQYYGTGAIAPSLRHVLFWVLFFWVWIYYSYLCPCMACMAPWMQQLNLIWQFACSHIPRCKLEKHLVIIVLLTLHNMPLPTEV